MEIVAQKFKAYANESKLTITIDQYLLQTVVIEFDLLSMQSVFWIYKQPEAKPKRDPRNIKVQPEINKKKSVSTTPDDRSNSNSYLHNGMLYQLNVSPVTFSIFIRNLSTGEVVDSLRGVDNEDITFRNTAIRQEGGGTYYSPAQRDLSSTNQFLRKVSAATAGLFVYDAPSGLVMTVGGTKEIAAVTGVPGAGMNPVGAVVVPVFNPVYTSFNSYTLSKTVSFSTLLDSLTFKHIPGDLTENIFDKIHTFHEKIDFHVTAETIFRKADQYLFGYYFYETKRFCLRSFR